MFEINFISMLKPRRPSNMIKSILNNVPQVWKSGS